MSVRTYFGTREFATWINTVAPGVGYNMVGQRDNLQYLGGGAGGRSSSGYHMEYTLSWPNASRDEVRLITDFYAGIHGDGLIHWLDPFAMDKNLLSAMWASPFLNCSDGYPLVGNERPKMVPNPDRSQLYPSRMAQYAFAASAPKRSAYVPVPPGYTAWIGAHGVASTQGLVARSTVAGTPVGAEVLVPIQSVSDRTRFSASIPGGEQGGVEISVDTSVAASITLAGVMIQVLPSLATPTDGAFISGQGNSGCEFDGGPAVTPYYVLGNESVGLSSRLIETGDWQ